MTLTGINGTTYTLAPTPIGSGGEGDIYSVRGMDYVAKIYRAGELTLELYEKLMVMIEHPPFPPAGVGLRTGDSELFLCIVIHVYMKRVIEKTNFIG